MFLERTVDAAFDHADAGGQALHLWHGGWPRTPRRSRLGDVMVGHLIDRDETRLLATAWDVGGVIPNVRRRGQRGQYVSLFGLSLQRVLMTALEE